MKIKVRYQCQHLTCRIAKCYEGEILLEKDKFDMFCDVNPEPGCFTSPSSVCKIGHTQTFKIFGTEEVLEEGKVKKGGVNTPPTTPQSVRPEPMFVANTPSDIELILNSIQELKKEVIGIKKEFGKLEKKVEKIERIKKGTKVSRRES